MVHVDANNLGPSWIIGLGDYTGGELWLADPDGDIELEVKQKMLRRSEKPGDIIKGRLINIKDKWFHFDGRVPHAAMPFQGNRFSLVYFTSKFHRKMDEHCKQDLVNLGFKLPEDYNDVSGDSDSSGVSGGAHSAEF